MIHPIRLASIAVVAYSYLTQYWQFVRQGKNEAAKNEACLDEHHEIHALVPAERIDRAILLIRGHKVLLDADLASLYGVTTKALKLIRRKA